MSSRRINYTSQNHQPSLDTINRYEFYTLSSRISKDLLNVIFDYSHDEKIQKIRGVTKKMIEKIGENYTIDTYYIPLVETSGRMIEITERIAKRKCGDCSNITCIINVDLNRILGHGNGHGLVLGTPFLMYYQSYMGPYQILGHLLNTSDITYNNNWIRRLITISGYENIDEFIYYSQHCNIWKINEQNLWILTNNLLMTYERPRNRQEEMSYNYRNNLNNMSEQIYLAQDQQITLEDLEMNRLRANFDEELSIWGEFARRVLRQNINPEQPDHIFTSHSLIYMRRLRRRYPGLSIREILAREITNAERYEEDFRRLYRIDFQATRYAEGYNFYPRGLRHYLLRIRRRQRIVSDAVNRLRNLNERNERERRYNTHLIRLRLL